jgi:hypothetical protein
MLSFTLKSVVLSFSGQGIDFKIYEGALFEKFDCCKRANYFYDGVLSV